MTYIRMHDVDRITLSRKNQGPRWVNYSFKVTQLVSNRART